MSQILGYATSITTVVLTALFIQKSDGNGALETVLLLGVATAGVFLVAAMFASHVYRADPLPHRISWYLSKRSLSIIGGFVGVALIIVSMTRIDREDSDYGQSAARHPPVEGADVFSKAGSTEIAVDGDSIKLRNLVVTSNHQASRMVVVIVNTSKAPVVLNWASFVTAGKVACATIGGEGYSLVGDVEIDEKGRARAELQADEGPLAGFPVQATGGYSDGCRSGQRGVQLRFPIAMHLNPLEANSLTIDVHNDVKAFRSDPSGRVETFSLSLRHEIEKGSFTEISVGYDAEEGQDSAKVCLSGDSQRRGLNIVRGYACARDGHW